MKKRKDATEKPFWVRTNNARGVEAISKINCPLHGKQMFLRQSELKHTQRETKGKMVVAPCVLVMYKCPYCALCLYFHVEFPVVDNEYWFKVMDWRNDYAVYIPPREEWTEEDAIKKQLEALGYWGG